MNSKEYYQKNKEKRQLNAKLWRIKNPDRQKETTKAWHERNPDYHAKRAGVCAICLQVCSTRRNLCVDHDHKTGKVRGLLCLDCNTAIGHLKDNEESLSRAIKYLESNK